MSIIAAAVTNAEDLPLSEAVDAVNLWAAQTGRTHPAVSRVIKQDCTHNCGIIRGVAYNRCGCRRRQPCAVSIQS